MQALSKFLQLHNKPARCLKVLRSSAEEVVVCLLLGTAITLDKTGQLLTMRQLLSLNDFNHLRVFDTILINFQKEGATE